MPERAYIGGELPLFEKAVHWKRYLARQIEPYLKGTVVEVGAGLGANSAIFCNRQVSRWLCLEPDPALFALLQDRFHSVPPFAAFNGTIQEIPLEAGCSDAVLYCDVLEHISDDRAELARAVRLLKPGGSLIVLAPAHMSLFSEFDAAIGHLRRYTRPSLAAAAPPGCRLGLLRYLDSAGLLASAANRLFLRQSCPTAGELLFWDRYLVPISRCLDPWFGYKIGKSVLAVWSCR